MRKAEIFWTVEIYRWRATVLGGSQMSLVNLVQEIVSEKRRWGRPRVRPSSTRSLRGARRDRVPAEDQRRSEPSVHCERHLMRHSRSSGKGRGSNPILEMSSRARSRTRVRPEPKTLTRAL